MKLQESRPRPSNLEPRASNLPSEQSPHDLAASLTDVLDSLAFGRVQMLGLLAGPLCVVAPVYPCDGRVTRDFCRVGRGNGCIAWDGHGVSGRGRDAVSHAGVRGASVGRCAVCFARVCDTAVGLRYRDNLVGLVPESAHGIRRTKVNLGSFGNPVEPEARVRGIGMVLAVHEHCPADGVLVVGPLDALADLRDARRLDLFGELVRRPGITAAEPQEVK